MWQGAMRMTQAMRGIFSRWNHFDCGLFCNPSLFFCGDGHELQT